MQDGPDLDPIDEPFEARAATRLASRGMAIAFIAGLLWYLPAGHWLPVLLLRIVATIVGIYAVMPLAPAALVFRNIIGRKLNLWGRKNTLLVLGIAIFACLLALAAFVFRLAGLAYG